MYVNMLWNVYYLFMGEHFFLPIDRDCLVIKDAWQLNPTNNISASPDPCIFYGRTAWIVITDLKNNVNSCCFILTPSYRYCMLGLWKTNIIESNITVCFA